jgi:hypothetical protein
MSGRVLAQGRSVGFDPSFRKQAGALWLRGDSLIQSGGLISGWADKFGNWPAATKVGATSAAYTASSPLYGGRPVWTGTDGVTTSYTIASFTLPVPNTIYVVCDATNAGSPSILDGSGTSREIIGTTASFWYFYAGTQVFSTFAAVATVNPPKVIGAIFNGANSGLYINASQTANISGNSGTSTGLAPIFIGGNNAGNQVPTGNIAEILILPGADTQTQMHAFFTYAGWYYALPGVG